MSDIPEAQDRLQEWVEEGGAVRSRFDQMLPGRCGAPLVRGRSERPDGGSYCNRGAGHGTDHKKVGRCSDHEDVPLGRGLPPWVGEIPDEEWLEITGGRRTPKEPSHGARTVEKVQKDFEDMIRKALPDEDQEVFDSIAVEPVRILDLEVKFNRVIAARVWRFIKRRTTANGRTPGSRRDPEVAKAENKLIKVSGKLARLMEVRVRYSELAEEKQNNDLLRGWMAEMTDREFRKFMSNPEMRKRMMAEERGDR